MTARERRGVPEAFDTQEKIFFLTFFSKGCINDNENHCHLLMFPLVSVFISWDGDIVGNDVPKKVNCRLGTRIQDFFYRLFVKI